MTVDDLDWICDFLENEGFSWYANELRGHFKAADKIIQSALEFDYGDEELIKAFKLYREYK